MTILVVGNATLDLTMRTARAPERGETVIATAPERGAGGKGFNQAVAAGRCGAAARLFAFVGDDDVGAYLQNEATRFGLPDPLTVVGGPSDTSTIVVADDGENLIISTVDAARQMTAAAAADAVRRVQPSTLLVQGNLSKAATLAALEAARMLRARTVANPSPIGFGWMDALRLVDILVVNAVEALALTGASTPAEGAAALRSAGAGEVVVTCGAAGALVLGPAEPQFLPGVPVAADDTTGAGDMFCGAIAALVERVPLARAVEPAMALAAVTVTRPGAARAFPSVAEARTIIAQHLCKPRPPDAPLSGVP